MSIIIGIDLGTTNSCVSWKISKTSRWISLPLHLLCVQKHGQVEAIRLAISRALSEMSDENKSALKKEGLLTRDPRMVERKKFGQKKARKKFQFSKR